MFGVFWKTYQRFLVKQRIQIQLHVLWATLFLRCPFAGTNLWELVLSWPLPDKLRNSLDALVSQEEGQSNEIIVQCSTMAWPVFPFIFSFEDIDECLTPATCPDAQCLNAPGSYQCIPCRVGFRGWNGQCHGMFSTLCLSGCSPCSEVLCFIFNQCYNLMTSLCPGSPFHARITENMRFLKLLYVLRHSM